MNIRRRQFLSRSSALALVAWAVPSTLLAKWPQAAFEKTQLEQAIAAVTGGAKPTSGKVVVSTPKIAENGAQVRVDAKVDIENVEWISVFVEKNPVPLVAKFMMTKSSIPHVSTNVKVRETSKIIVIAKAGDHYYSGQETVKVTAGGCG